MDQWTSAEGLQQFFADPQVQVGASALFTSFDPVDWRPADGFNAYQIASPLAEPRNRFVGVLRGSVTSLDSARATLNEIWRERVHTAHRKGLDSHEVFVRLVRPGAIEGSPEGEEILAVDTWSSPSGPDTIYADPTFRQALYGLFASQPSSGVWHRPAGDWIEW